MPKYEVMMANQFSYIKILKQPSDVAAGYVWAQVPNEDGVWGRTRDLILLIIVVVKWVGSFLRTCIRMFLQTDSGNAALQRNHMYH